MRSATILSLLALSVCSFTAAVDLCADSMVLVPAGTFVMGDGVAYCGEDERQVTLTRDFYLGQHEVTNQEYLVMVQWAYDNGLVTVTSWSVRDNLDGSTVELLELRDDDCEIQFNNAGTFYLRESPGILAQAAYPEGYDPSGHPVKEVTWYGAVAYCDWLTMRKLNVERAYDHATWECNGGDPYGAVGFRLPTDAEREYAAQYDDERIYPWGEEDPDCSRANYYSYEGACVGWTTPVGAYPGAPLIGGDPLFDMAGNVDEWCNDMHECHLGTSPEIDPVGPAACGLRLVRGGSWEMPGRYLRCASRYEVLPEIARAVYGFRIAKTAPASRTEGGLDVDRPQLLVGSGLPNPFRSSTRITYLIPGEASSTRVLLHVYDVAGRVVRTLVDDSQASGSYTVAWDGRDEQGCVVSTGVYLYRVTGEGNQKRGKIILLR